MADYTPPDFTSQDSATYKANIDAGLAELRRRNWLVDGDFSIWKRGTSFTADGYGADRWLAALSDGAATISRQAHTLGQVDVPGEPRYHYRHNQTGAATAAHTFLEQRIEGVRSLAGAQVSVGFWGKAAAAADYQVGLRQHFGTGGAPSADVTTAQQTVNLGTGFLRSALQFTVPSVSGKTVGSNDDDYLSLEFESPGGVTFTVDLSCLQLEPGPVATAIEMRPPAAEEVLAGRFYQAIPARTVNGDLWVGFPVPARTAAPTVAASVGTIVASTRLGALINHTVAGATNITVEDEL